MKARVDSTEGSLWGFTQNLSEDLSWWTDPVEVNHKLHSIIRSYSALLVHKRYGVTGCSSCGLAKKWGRKSPLDNIDPSVRVLARISTSLYPSGKWNGGRVSGPHIVLHRRVLGLQSITDRYRVKIRPPLVLGDLLRNHLQLLLYLRY